LYEPLITTRTLDVLTGLKLIVRLILLFPATLEMPTQLDPFQYSTVKSVTPYIENVCELDGSTAF
jgi:hypothetical protein